MSALLFNDYPRFGDIGLVTGLPNIPSKKALEYSPLDAQLNSAKHDPLPSEFKLFSSVATPTLQSTTGQVRQTASLEERLYDNRAALKLAAASVGMYIKETRANLFKQLDGLLDVEEWDDRDKPGSAISFSTLLRFLLHSSPTKMPGLGLANNGYFIGAWTGENSRLTLEFLPEDKIRWVVSSVRPRGIETAAGVTRIERIQAVLAPYNLEWFR